MAIIVHVTFGEMTPRRVQSPRVKRESIHHYSNPTVFDRSQSGLQTLASQPARYVRGARADPIVLPLNPIATVIIEPGTSSGSGVDAGDPCGMNGLSDLSALQARFMQELTNSFLAGRTFEDAYWDLLTSFGNFTGGDFNDHEVATLHAVYDVFKSRSMTNPSLDALRAFISANVPGRTVPVDEKVACVDRTEGQICTTSDGIIVPQANMVCGPVNGVETCKVTRAYTPESLRGLSDPEFIKCSHWGAHIMREDLLSANQIKAALDQEITGAQTPNRRRRRTQPFSGGRSRTPSGFRRQPIKRSAGPHNLPGQGRAL